MAMSHLRNLGLNIEFRIFCILQQTKWTVQKDLLPLQQVAGEARTYECKGYTKGFCWLKTVTDPDAGEIPTVTRDLVVVKAGTVTIPQIKYTVDFVRNRITFIEGYAVPSGALTVSALFWVVRVVEGYPSEDDIEKVELPSIAWDIDGTAGKPFAIGTSLQFRRRFVTVDILARSRGEQMDLLDDVQRQIARIPLLNMRDGTPLLESGQINPSFSFLQQFFQVIPLSGSPTGTLLQPRQGGTEKEQFRGLVSIETEMVS
jgi:hypothetical protein